MSKTTGQLYATKIVTASGRLVVVGCCDDEPVVAQRVEVPGGNIIHLWDAQDAIEIGHALIDDGLRVLGRIREPD